jgi:phage-related protein
VAPKVNNMVMYESRIIFTLFKNMMILLHGFVKKTKKTRQHDLDLARNRMRKFLQDPQT